MLNVVVVGDWSNGAVSGEDPWSYLKRRLSRFVEEGSGGEERERIVILHRVVSTQCSIT